MATTNSLKQTINNKNVATTQTKVAQAGIKGLLNSPEVQNKFKAVLKEKSAGFTSSVLSLVNNDTYLAQCEPMSILTCAMTAATLDLPLDKNLGYAYIVPFKDYKQGNKQIGQFILGYKGYIQLAQRSGQYKSLNVIPIYEGELGSWNRLTEEFVFNTDGRVSDVVIGYVGYFELLNGFKKTTYWTKEDVERHRQKHAKGRDKKPTGVWATDFDVMACKTVLRALLSKWGILSIDMQTAEKYDEKALEDVQDGEIKVVTPIEDEQVVIEGTENDFTVDKETGEVIEVSDKDEFDMVQDSLFEDNTTKVKV